MGGFNRTGECRNDLKFQRNPDQEGEGLGMASERNRGGIGKRAMSGFDIERRKNRVTKGWSMWDGYCMSILESPRVIEA